MGQAQQGHALEDRLWDVKPGALPRQHREQGTSHGAEPDDEDGGDAQSHVVVLDMVVVAVVVFQLFDDGVHVLFPVRGSLLLRVEKGTTEEAGRRRGEEAGMTATGLAVGLLSSVSRLLASPRKPENHPDHDRDGTPSVALSDHVSGNNLPSHRYSISKTSYLLHNWLPNSGWWYRRSHVVLQRLGLLVQYHTFGSQLRCHATKER